MSHTRKLATALTVESTKVVVSLQEKTFIDHAPRGDGRKHVEDFEITSEALLAADSLIEMLFENGVPYIDALVIAAKI